MKKILLLFSILLIVGNAMARIRVVFSNPEAGIIKIKNVAGYPYDYNNFILSINDFGYDLSTVNIENGADMDMDTDEVITITGLSIPTSCSMGIWYPGTDVINGLPGPTNMVDFAQFGSSSNHFEDIAVMQGFWGQGEFVEGIPPYTHDGGTANGVSHWSSTTGVNEHGFLDGLSIFPNPVSDALTFKLPVSSSSLTLEILNTMGQSVKSVPNIQSNQAITVDELKSGIYFVRLSENGTYSKSIKLMKL